MTLIIVRIVKVKVCQTRRVLMKTSLETLQISSITRIMFQIRQTLKIPRVMPSLSIGNLLKITILLLIHFCKNNSSNPYQESKIRTKTCIRHLTMQINKPCRIIIWNLMRTTQKMMKMMMIYWMVFKHPQIYYAHLHKCTNNYRSTLQTNHTIIMMNLNMFSMIREMIKIICSHLIP